jgi:hypothetical protein
MRPEVEARLWAKVDKTPTCWLWRGAKSRGYGRFKVDTVHAPRVHRIVWELTHGPIPTGLSVLHRCDTPACVNPAHLFLGTQRDNVYDAIEKGRHRIGDRVVRLAS